MQIITAISKNDWVRILYDECAKTIFDTGSILHNNQSKFPRVDFFCCGDIEVWDPKAQRAYTIAGDQ